MSKINGNEVKLCKELIVWLKKEMISRLTTTAPKGTPKGVMYDHAQSNFEWGCNVMEKVGIFERANVGGRAHNYWQVAKVSNEHIEIIQYTRGIYDALLFAFTLHIDYVDELHKIDQPVIASSSSLLCLCKAFVDCGYMTEEDNGSFVWTLKFQSLLQKRE